MARNVKNLNESNNNEVVSPAKAKSKNSSQYVGISLMLLSYVLACIITNFAGPDNFASNIAMLIVMTIAVILAAVGYMTIAIVVGAVSVVSFIGIMIYLIMSGDGITTPISLLWVLLPVIAISGIWMFTSGYSSLVLENALMQKQISDLVMIDPVTGLYNLRSMYMDIQTQISYSERNDSPISLMIIRLRYPMEMKKVLKQTEYAMVVKQLSLLLVDTVRLEDRVYSIDENGGFGIILTCDKDGTKIVEKRMRAKLEDPKWFSNVSAKSQIRAEVKIGYMQYDKNKFNRDAHSFKESVEEEVDYDI